jgi:hypothetical protein
VLSLTAGRIQLSLGSSGQVPIFNPIHEPTGEGDAIDRLCEAPIVDNHLERLALHLSRQLVDQLHTAMGASSPAAS